MEIVNLLQVTLNDRTRILKRRALLAGISGIDASGKGHVAHSTAIQLESAGYRVALVGADGWLHLPHRRFSQAGRGIHFYHNALRLDEMFQQLILPLKRDRCVDLTMKYTDETATEYRPHRYLFRNIDIVLLEGIFIYKRAYTQNFDIRIWVECSFDTALKRAVSRGQESLSPVDTRRAYETIYFPAQRYHFAVDRPHRSAHLVFRNDDDPPASIPVPNFTGIHLTTGAVE